MELIEYYRLFRRWWWLIVITAFVGGVVTYITVDSREPVYRASTQLSIGSFLSSPNPQTGEIRLGQDLAVTYSELVDTFQVLDATVNALDLPFAVDELAELISTRIVPETSLVVIAVEYTNPVVAANIANEIAHQLIQLSPTNLTPDQQAQIDIAREQIDNLSAELETLRLQLQQVSQALDDAEDDEEIERLINQRNLLYEQINQRSSSIASFTSTIAGYSQRTNSVEIVETARIPDEPVPANVLQSAVLVALIAASLVSGLVLAFEYLNDTFRTTEDITHKLDLPVLGAIAQMGDRKRTGYKDVLIHKDVLSQHFEHYNTLQANLLFRTPDTRQPTFVITSAIPFEGKTLTAVNLAIAMGIGEKKVLLVDADLRKPRLHQIFDIPNVVGLSNLLATYETQQKSNGSRPDHNTYVDAKALKSSVHKTPIPNLSVLTSGHSKENVTRLLNTEIITRWTQAFYEHLDVDVVIFDTPPVLMVVDSMVIARQVDAHVLLIVAANSTRRSAAQRAKERFVDIHHDILGVVLNRVKLANLDYYGYHSYRYYSDEPAKGRQPVRK